MPSLEKLKAWASVHQTHCDIEERGKGPCTCDQWLKENLIAFVEAFDSLKETIWDAHEADVMHEARKALEEA